MRAIREVFERGLHWAQPSVMRREYELSAAEDVVGRLRWEQMLGSLASAESADGTWTFKRSGFLSPRVTARVGGTNDEIAALRPSWRGEGTLELAAGGRYRWLKPSFWGSEWIFATETDEPLVRIKPRFALLKLAADVTVEPGAAGLPQLSLLTLLGWYLVVLMSEDSGGSGGGSAAGAG